MVSQIPAPRFQGDRLSVIDHDYEVRNGHSGECDGMLTNSTLDVWF